jgi:hypothetical protein
MGPTVCELEGPIPILKISNTLVFTACRPTSFHSKADCHNNLGITKEIGPAVTMISGNGLNFSWLRANAGLSLKLEKKAREMR